MRTLPVAARGPAPIRLTSGRQTLGSNHDAPPGGPYPREEAPDGFQTTDSTRPVWWHIFKDHCGSLRGERRRTADRLVQHLETGWALVMQLQLECERQHADQGVAQDAQVAHLIGFLESEVLGAFMECAERCARVVSEAGEPEERVDGLYSMVARLERGITISAFASESAHLPCAFKATLECVSNALVDWSADFGALIAVIGNDIQVRS